MRVDQTASRLHLRRALRRWFLEKNRGVLLLCRADCVADAAVTKPGVRNDVRDIDRLNDREGLGEVTRGRMLTDAVGAKDELRHLGAAQILDPPAPRVEAAPSGRVRRRRDIALQDDMFPLAAQSRMASSRAR